MIHYLVDCAKKARKDGMLALEEEMRKAPDEFGRKAFGMVVDGVDPKIVRECLETEIDIDEEVGHSYAKVFESAGGFAPTIGILGAVLGLIHVMENLSDPSKLGGGIATAFVATVYGVAVANLIFLPMANKIKRKLHVEKERKTLIAEGVLSIQAGLNPRVLEEKLAAYAGGHAPPKSADAGAAAEKA
jgi:chemotaxis protein MotA